MSNPAAFGSATYEVESAATAWAEDVSTFATHRLPAVGAIDVSGLVHNKVAPERVEQYRNAGSQWIKMTQGGSFKIKMDLAGHGSTMVGSPTLDALETYFGLVIGNATLSAAASSTITGGTAAVPLVTASGTFAAGSLVSVGTLGDGDGDGQMYPIATHVTTTMTLLAALRGVPVAAQVIRPVSMIYPNSLPTATAIVGTRFLLQTANLAYQCHGCFPMAVSLTGLSAGERPQIEVTWGVSRWSYSTATFPNTVTSNRYNPAPIAAGSLHVNDVGTATRAEYKCRNFSIDITLGVEPLRGPAGVSAFQDIIGAVRIDDNIKVSFTLDADAKTATPVLPGWGTGTTSKSIMWTGSPTDGSSIGIWLPKVCATTVPVQKADGNINRLTFEGQAYTSDTTTSAVTLAAMILGLA